MKTIIVLSALATIAIAVPAPVWENGIKQDSKLNGIFKPVKRERKSTIQDSSAELSLDHESGSLINPAKDHKTHGFRKPILVKKKFGYQIFRDSDEELAQAQPRETCRRQFRFKLCDESGETTATDMKKFNTEADIEETDVQHSLKMAKEAVKILQRDLQKIEESSIVQKNRKDEDLESKLHNNIEQAKETSQQLYKNINNLDFLSSSAVSSKESKIGRTDSKLEESRMILWKEAIENIQKNVEIVKNIEDTFKSSELTHLLSGEEIESPKSKNVDHLDSTHFQTLHSNLKGREMENPTAKKDENLVQDNHNKEAKVSDMLSYATESKQTNVGLHSDSLKVDTARNWDITENMRHAENDAIQKKNDFKEVNTVMPQEKAAEVKSSEVLKVLIEEPKSVTHTDQDDFQLKKVIKKTDILEDSEKDSHNKIQHEKNSKTENTENSLESSNNFNKVEVEDVKKHTTQDKNQLKSAEDLSNHGKTIESFTTVTDDTHIKNEFRGQEKDSETSESRNFIQSDNLKAKEALNKNSFQEESILAVEKNTDSEKKSIIESNLHPDIQISVMRSADSINENASGFHNTKWDDGNQLKMLETLQENSGEKQVLEKTVTEKKESEINNMRADQYSAKMDQSHSSMKLSTSQGSSDKIDYGKSGVIETTKTHQYVDPKISTDKQINNNSEAFQKSVDLKNTEEKSNHLAKDQKNKENNLQQGSNMRFNEFGDLNHNLPVNNLDISPLENDNHQRMPDMDFYNNFNSQHGAQLVADKNLDFHTSSHINQGMSEWERNQQHLHSMLRPTPFMPWMQDRLRNNMELQTGNHFHPDNMGHLHLDHHDHHFNLEGHHHHHHALPMGNVFKKTGMNHDSLKSTMMRDNNFENGGSMDLDSSMQPSMKINMRGVLDQSGMNWDYHQASGKSGFSSNIGSGTVGVFPNANTGCGIPLLLSCSPSVVSGSLAKQSSLGYGHSLKSGDDLRFYTKRDAQAINDIGTANSKTIPTSPN